jgi:hypothetical protein
MTITKEVLALGFSFIALAFSTYNFIRSLIETRMKYELDYSIRRFGIDLDLASFEAQVIRKEGDAHRLRFDGEKADVPKVVEAAEAIENNQLKPQRMAITNYKNDLEKIPESYAGRKFIVRLDILRNQLKKSHANYEVIEAIIDNTILAARRLLPEGSAQQLIQPERE